MEREDGGEQRGGVRKKEIDSGKNEDEAAVVATPLCLAELRERERERERERPQQQQEQQQRAKDSSEKTQDSLSTGLAVSNAGRALLFFGCSSKQRLH